MIDGGKLLAILRGFLTMLKLSGHRRNALLAGGGQLSRGGRTSDAAWAVVADIVHGGVVDGCVVNRGVGDAAVVYRDVAAAHIINSAVVFKPVSIPIATLIAGSGVTVSVIDAAVIADMPAPVAVVIAIATAAISPPSGRPQITGFGWTRPRAGDPVVAV